MNEIKITLHWNDFIFEVELVKLLTLRLDSNFVIAVITTSSVRTAIARKEPPLHLPITFLPSVSSSDTVMFLY